MKMLAMLAALMIMAGAAAADCAETGFHITVSLDAGLGELSGDMRLMLTGGLPAGSRELAFNLRFDRERQLVCSDWHVNGQPTAVVVNAGLATMALPGDLAGDPIVVTCSFSLRDLPETGGIILLEDNLRSGLWLSWYPRLLGPEPASYEVDFRAAAGGLAAPANERTFSEESGALRWQVRSGRSRTLPLYYSSLFRERRVRVGNTDLGLFYREGSELWGEKLLVILAEVEAWYAANVVGYGRPRLDVVLADEEYDPGAWPPAVAVIRDRTGEMGEEYGGVFVANHLRFQAAAELARAHWAPRLPASPGGIPWLAEGLSLAEAERYTRAALLGGPSFENIRQFYLSVAGSVDTRLDQPADKAEAAGIDPLVVLAQGKGSWVVAMLAQEMGKSAFTTFQRALIERVDEPIDSPEISALAEQALGRSLKDFFSTWVSGDATVNYGIGEVSVRDDGLRVQILNKGTATPPAELRVVLAEGGEKSEIVRPQGQETWVSFATAGPAISVRLDPDGTLPDLNRSDNFRSLGGSERIERLYGIDAAWEIGDIVVAMPPRGDAGNRWAEFQLTVTNRQDKTGSLGLRLTSQFPGGRNRGITRLYLELAAGETRTFRERLDLPTLGAGQLLVTAEYFSIFSREGYERIDRASVPALVNYYAVDVPGGS